MLAFRLMPELIALGALVLIVALLAIVVGRRPQVRVAIQRAAQRARPATRRADRDPALDAEKIRYRLGLQAPGERLSPVAIPIEPDPRVALIDWQPEPAGSAASPETVFALALLDAGREREQIGSPDDELVREPA